MNPDGGVTVGSECVYHRRDGASFRVRVVRVVMFFGAPWCDVETESGEWVMVPAFRLEALE